MFNKKEKQKIAEAVEKLLLSFDHPEMPKDKPYFELHVDGLASWSWADIVPNWKHEAIIPRNEKQEKLVKREK